MNDLIFSIDPGSIRSGFAVVNRSQRLIEAGVLEGDKRTAGAEFRINDQCKDLWHLLDKHRPKTILIEWCSGKINHRRHKGTGQGLQIHGVATGALWCEIIAWRRTLPAEDAIQVNINLIPENTWTRQVPKRDRQIAIASMFQEYSIERDLGGDIADALGLAVWFLRHQLVKLAEYVK